MFSPPPSCLAGAQRESGHQLQREAEGEVPAPPADQTHRSPPAPAQEHLPPEAGDAHHEGGPSQEVRAPFISSPPLQAVAAGPPLCAPIGGAGPLPGRAGPALTHAATAS